MALKQRWSADILRALGIRLAIHSKTVPGATLVVANHISWLDIFVINATFPAAFVAKADMRRWPLIGWLAAQNDTIFLRRGSRGHARLIQAEIVAKLSAGKPVVIFPEGTTTDGSQVLRFHSALLQPALATGYPVTPLALSYHCPDGQRSLAPRYDGDISLGASLANLLACQELEARLTACSPMAAEPAERKETARAARATIIKSLGLMPDTSTKL